MADPNNPIRNDDIHYEDRGGCFVLIDPSRPEGRMDVASAWQEDTGIWRWRLDARNHDGLPYPSADNRDAALSGMLRDYAHGNDDVTSRLSGQMTRHSFGMPQIVKAA